MSKRTVLVLEAGESQIKQLQRHPLLQAAESRFREQFTNIHYDTRRLALRKEGIVVQLREQRMHWMQSVERQLPSDCGLVGRSVWTTPYPNHFDFSGVDDERLRALLEGDKIAGNLIPVFETSYHRTSWQLHPVAGAAVRLVMDKGWIASNGRRASLSEVSLELVDGTTDDLYALAGHLAERILLTPCLVSRSERGYRLFLNIKPTPVAAKGARITKEAEPLDAFRTVALACAADMHLNHAGAMGSGDPEYVHQMRVAIRRLRAAIRIFKPVLPPDFADQVVPRIREVVNTLGRVRDLDVLTGEIVLPVIDGCPGEPCLADLAGVLTERLHRARVDAAQKLSQPEYGQQVLLLTRLLHSPAFVPSSLTPTDALAPFAERRLHRLHKKVLTLAAQARADDPVSLHELRIAIKHLRYGMEFLGEFLPKKEGKTMLSHLVVLQEDLGQLNDLANAGSILMASAVGDATLRKAVALIAEWHGERHARLLDDVASRLKKFRKRRLKK